MAEIMALKRVLNGEVFKLTSEAQETYVKPDVFYKVDEQEPDIYSVYRKYTDENVNETRGWISLSPSEIVNLFLICAGPNFENIEFVKQEKDVQKITDFLSFLISASNLGLVTFPVMAIRRENELDINAITFYELGVAEKENMVIANAEGGKFTLGRNLIATHMVNCIANFEWSKTTNTFYKDLLMDLVIEYLSLFDPIIVKDIYSPSEGAKYVFAVIPFLDYCMTTYHCKPLMER